MNNGLTKEIARRRTFAIISHPDAGKTTLTEKLLLYGGALRTAGSVKGPASSRKATSDWMELEQQRGISVTSTVLQFEYDDHVLNLLDTPGHEDFSEDTYRTLTAADSAVMLIDAAKGIEPQTRKLFEVCRLRRIPIFTFINKMDRPGRDPIELIDELEGEFGIAPFPVNWPVGLGGPQFAGVFDRLSVQAHLYERTSRGAFRAPVEVSGLEDERLSQVIGPTDLGRLREELELLEGAGSDFDTEAFRTGAISPVFFGSAVNNFGIDLFLDRFIDYAPPPGPRRTSDGTQLPEAEELTGFIFKIQANMDPQHRDRVAFMRICSGRYEKDMQVTNTRTGKTLRLTRSQKLFGQERETVDEAFPGDVVGLMNPGAFAIGDTVTTGRTVEFEPIPQFSPEHFVAVRNINPAKRKALKKGLDQLREEGAIQVFHEAGRTSPEPVLAAVGQLQFDVVKFRLEREYGVEVGYHTLPYVAARWIDATPEQIAAGTYYSGTALMEDVEGNPVMLYQSAWHIDATAEKNPDLRFESARIAKG